MGSKELEPQPEFIKIELVQALPDDLKELDRWIVKTDGNYIKKEKLRLGLPYWLKSMITGKMEPSPYILNQETDPDDIAEYLKFGMIYIAKNPFKNENTM